MLPRFLSSGQPFDDNQLFASLRQCAGKGALGALLDALTKPAPMRSPLEITDAVGEALVSPQLAHDAEATHMVAARLAAVPDASARAALTYTLWPRDATPALSRILSEDPDPDVRAAAAIALRNCKTAPDFAVLWRAAAHDPDRRVRGEAYLTLDRFGQLRNADQLLAASRAQIDARTQGRLLKKWLVAEKSSDEDAAEILTGLAGQTGSQEASGALAAILIALEPPSRPLAMMVLGAPPPPPPIPAGPLAGPRAALIRSAPIAIPKVEETGLQRALYQRRAAITRAALAQFAASKNLSADAARGAIDCALAVNRCGPGRCAHLGEILGVSDRMPAALALEASHDIWSGVGTPYVAYRLHRYRVAFLAALLAAGLLLLGGYASRRAPIFAIGAGWLLVVAPTALLQRGFGVTAGATSWPPPALWPATALGSVAVTLLVAVAATLALARRPGWLILTALTAGEAAWWLVPGLLEACGITLTMQHYAQDENWLPFLLALFMIVAAPVMTLAISGAAHAIQRMVFSNAARS